MIILRNPSSHPLFQPLVPSFAYHWVVQDKKNEENNPTTQKKDGASATPMTNNNDTCLTIAHGDFELIQQHKDDGHFLLTTDLPGVKHSHLKVEFRENSIDVANLSATLEDGILAVKAPLKKGKEEDQDPVFANQNSKLTVLQLEPPSLDASVALNLEIDVPGIKVNDLHVVCDKKSGMLHVVGERHKPSGPNNKVTKTLYRLNTGTVDVAKLETYLMDGVLTIRAPAKAHPIMILAVNGQSPVAASEDSNKQQDETPEDTKIEEEKKEPKNE
ncbi:expressed unknown protein [Seminavis robusta]|uniref:SHSP domain-containing protein n=1 Tax=Seminavis robusta TaxID=568900 RepID=A0A9N8EJ42_9STRA|nr:expressed unknown protein [Seminavis robusta]|eukprot:Sro1184_g250090.1 n/a (273) ;mRNA; r:6218-7113